jgi:hypothetical protein
MRVEHVVVQVGDLDRALAWYRILYGREKRRSRTGATFAFRNGSRLELEKTRYVHGGAARPRISRYGIRVMPFDRAATEAAVVALGGTVIGGEGGALRLRDVDGNELELVAG